MKISWRKNDKALYLPKDEPIEIDVPKLNYIVLSGKGNPNSEEFKEYIGALYSIAYGVRMSYKWDTPPTDYVEYTVYPLEGVWDIANKEIYEEGKLDKNNLKFDLMIRQPDFLDMDLFDKVMAVVKKKKPHYLLDEMRFVSIDEGNCVQILHKGSYDNEYLSFEKMDEYCAQYGLKRLCKTHREIYLSDPRKTESDKLKTVLRYKIEKI